MDLLGNTRFLEHSVKETALSGFQVHGGEGKIPLERDSDMKSGPLVYVNLGESILFRLGSRNRTSVSTSQILEDMTF